MFDATGDRHRRGRARAGLLDVSYYAAVLVKGVDGAIELVAGSVLVFVPGLATYALVAVSAEAAESRAPLRQWLAGYVENLDDEVARTGVLFLVVFLLLHGLVKLVLVYCLLHRYRWAYPYALAVLTAFLGFQLYILVTTPTVSMALLTALDALIIVLVGLEYRRLTGRARPQRQRTMVRGGP
jgi:uncharacterized membrane protein